MARQRLTIRQYLSVGELKKLYMDCTDGVEKTHWQTIWLLARTDATFSAEEVGSLLGYCADWVRRLARRYNKMGPAGLEDKRKYNGQKQILSETKRKQLEELLRKRPRDGGLWTSKKVSTWMSGKLARKVSSVTGWKYLKRLGFTLQVPRPKHGSSATKAEQTAFKKTLKTTF
jgi:transposase